MGFDVKAIQNMKSNPRGRLKVKLVRLAHRFGVSPLIRSLRREARAVGGVIRFKSDAIESDTGDLLLRFRIEHLCRRVLSPEIWRDVGSSDLGKHRRPESYPSRRGRIFQTASGDIIKFLDMLELTDPFAGYIEKGAPTEGNMVLDAGAFCGECTIEFARMVGESGHVYALEPDPVNRKVMIRNLEKNGILNVTICPYAMWNTNETLSFAIRGDSASALTGASMFETEQVDKLEVDGKTAAAIFEQMGGIPDFIKMDIEGAKVEAVESMIPLLKESGKRCRMAIASCHFRAGRRTHEIISPLLVSAGFQVETGYAQHTTTWVTCGERNDWK